MNYLIDFYISFVLFHRVYQAKQWDLLKVFNDHTALATGIRFGSDANYLASASMDRSLKFYQQLSQE